MLSEKEWKKNYLMNTLMHTSAKRELMEEDMENMVANQKSRLNLNVTAELSEKLNSWADTLQLTLSEMMRKALSEYIEKLERNKREQQLAEACKNYRQFNKKFSSEWAKFETRIE
jgi:hypothetical protein